MEKVQQTIKMNKATATEVVGLKSGLIALQLSEKKYDEALLDLFDTMKDVNDRFYMIDVDLDCKKPSRRDAVNITTSLNSLKAAMKESIGNLIVNPLDEEVENAEI